MSSLTICLVRITSSVCSKRGRFEHKIRSIDHSLRKIQSMPNAVPRRAAIAMKSSGRYDAIIERSSRRLRNIDRDLESEHRPRVFAAMHNNIRSPPSIFSFSATTLTYCKILSTLQQVRSFFHSSARYRTSRPPVLTYFQLNTCNTLVTVSVPRL